jgi:hypothetical protein
MSFCLGIQLNILLVGFVGLKYSKFGNFAGVFNFLLSLTVVGFYGVLSFIITKNYIKLHKDILKKIKNKKMGLNTQKINNDSEEEKMKAKTENEETNESDKANEQYKSIEGSNNI